MGILLTKLSHWFISPPVAQPRVCPYPLGVHIHKHGFNTIIPFSEDASCEMCQNRDASPELSAVGTRYMLNFNFNIFYYFSVK